MITCTSRDLIRFSNMPASRETYMYIAIISRLFQTLTLSCFNNKFYLSLMVSIWRCIIYKYLFIEIFLISYRKTQWKPAIFESFNGNFARLTSRSNVSRNIRHKFWKTIINTKWSGVRASLLSFLYNILLGSLRLLFIEKL